MDKLSCLSNPNFHQINNPYHKPLNAGILEIESIDKLVFKPCGLVLESVEQELESREYNAHNFKLSGRSIKFRKSKITPMKTGQFVTIWKRNANGATEPFQISDPVDFYIIAAMKGIAFGIFIFPKNILHEKGILSDETKGGKRGIRVYPTWDLATNKQAQKTQLWQTKYFLDLSDVTAIDIEKAKRVFAL